jgi:hypothetical protein
VVFETPIHEDPLWGKLLPVHELAVADFAFPLSEDDAIEIVVTGVPPGHGVNAVLVAERIILGEGRIALEDENRKPRKVERGPIIEERWHPGVDMARVDRALDFLVIDWARHEARPPQLPVELFRALAA